MSVLLIAEANLTEEVYAGIAGQMTPLIRAAKGLICHPGGPNPAGGWRVVEIWESEEDGKNWFDHNIKPNPATRRRAEAYVLPTSRRGHKLGCPRLLP